MTLTTICKQCLKTFSYETKIKRNFRIYCPPCVKERKINYRRTYRDTYETTPTKRYCPICRNSINNPLIIHKGRCERISYEGNSNIDREYWKEHIQNGVVDDEMSEMI